MVYQRGDSSRGAVCLWTWNPLQAHVMCWCVGGQTANMAEKGMMASDYGTEYAWQIRTVSYSPVGDEVILPNTCLLYTSDAADE